MNINIRKANLDDLLVIQELNHSLFKYEIENNFDNYIEDWSLGDMSKDYFECMIQEEFVILAEINGDVVGYLAGSLNKDNTYSYYEGLTAELNNMFIVKEYRKYGIGSKLVSSFLSWCNEQEAKRVIVTASIGNTNTINFYKKNGFEEINITLKKEIK